MVMIILTLKCGLGVYPVHLPKAQTEHVRPSKPKCFAWEHTASCGRGREPRSPGFLCSVSPTVLWLTLYEVEKLDTENVFDVSLSDFMS